MCFTKEKKGDRIKFVRVFIKKNAKITYTINDAYTIILY